MPFDPLPLSKSLPLNAGFCPSLWSNGPTWLTAPTAYPAYQNLASCSGWLANNLMLLATSFQLPTTARYLIKYLWKYTCQRSPYMKGRVDAVKPNGNDDAEGCRCRRTNPHLIVHIHSMPCLVKEARCSIARTHEVGTFRQERNGSPRR